MDQQDHPQDASAASGTPCTGAQIIVELLARQGVEVVAGIPGGANLPIYDALATDWQQRRRIRHVLARHEQAAGFMAQGMARVSGRPGVALATSGPGAMNLLTAVADAKLDSIPMICITGQVPSGCIGADAFQEVDTYGLTIPITKHNYLVRNVEELLQVIPVAFRIAASGRPGPVLIDVPKDVQTAICTVSRWPDPGQPQPARAADLQDVQRAAEHINAAQRPVLYLGGGVVAADACHLARALAERAGIPAAMTLMGLGALPARHPLALGMLGMHAARSTNLLLEEADLLIALGARFDDRATGKLAAFCPDAALVHVDIDPAELHKLRTAHVGIAADVRLTLEALLPRIAPRTRRAWRQRVEERKAQCGMRLPGEEDIRRPYGLIRAVAELAGPEAVVVTDVGKHQMWTAQAHPYLTPRRWLTSGGLGTMGFGLPTALGAALAAPHRKVICFTGDGSLQMNIQELATAAEQQLDVTVVVLDNHSLGLVRQQQQLFYSNPGFASEYTLQVDFPAVARAMGVR
ncbi:MAG: biosynthetic-type acetolactate synthase large subunit, partial [Desulfovibrio sp.]|nr:biosynthetic-type acetolactate synthase large subunit [Desulfovibrio sp.]